MKSSKTQYANLIASFAQKRIMIVGDVMIDAYCFGKVERISPEAPVPVVLVEKKDHRLGGAANVALNIKALGAEAVLCGVVGKDEQGKTLAQLLKKNDISSAFLYASSHRPTTTKMRVMGNATQLLRVDEEQTSPLAQKEEKDFIEKCLQVLQSQKIDAIIFEDYDKGALTPALIESLLCEARKYHIPTAVDPKKRNFLQYKGVTLFKPNLKEIREGLKLDILTPHVKEVGEVAEKLRKSLDAEMVMVTMSEHGILVRNRVKTVHLPAQLRRISDVSGAGDTVISVATLCLTLGLNQDQTAYIANMAGGLVCEYVGVVPINKEELVNELKTYSQSV